MDAQKMLFTALVAIGTWAIVNRVGFLKAIVVPKVDGVAQVSGSMTPVVANPPPLKPVPGVGSF